jgi:hypothetical protein
MYLSTKPSYILNWCIGFHHKIYTIYTQKKNSQKFTQFSQLDYGEIINLIQMPTWRSLKQIRCYLAMPKRGCKQVDCSKSCWEYTQDSTPSKMSKAWDEYTNHCKSTHHIRPLALVEVVIGIIQFTTHKNQYFISCILNFKK